MRGVWVSVLKIVAFYAIWLAGITASILAVTHYAGPGWDKNLSWKFVAESGGMLAAIAAFLFMTLAVDRRPFRTLGFPAHGSAGLFIGTVVGALIFCLPLGILMQMGYAHYAPDFSAFDPAVLGWLLAIMAVNVIDQEMLVRSYPFQIVWCKHSGALAVLVSTIIFVGLHAGAIVHGTNGLLAGANVALASILLGVAYLRTGALWLPIGIHFGWNAFQGPVLGINVTGMELGGHWHAFALDGPALWTGGAMGVEGGLAGLAGPLLGMLIVLMYPRGHNALAEVSDAKADAAAPPDADASQRQAHGGLRAGLFA